jgi:hypothetical protein
MLPGISLEQGRASKGHGERAQAGSNTRASAGAKVKSVLRAPRLAWPRRVTGVVALFHSAPGARGRDVSRARTHRVSSAQQGECSARQRARSGRRRHAGTRAHTHTHTHISCPCTPTGLSSGCGICPARLDFGV